MDGSAVENEIAPKKRERKKQLHKNILSQMEFYFSAANLSKDRWLSKKLEEEGAIHLTEFLKFNKIRALTLDVNDLAKALRKSEIITVTEEMKVKRIQPVKFKENEDDYIIYVEQIPSDADHEWLSSFFSSYGKIDYISIPKFRSSGKCKGFAFIEFAEIESAEKAIKDYKEKGNYLPIDTEPAELISVSTYEEPESQESDKHRSIICDNSKTLIVESEMVETIDKDKSLNKRKISLPMEDLPKEKKPKTSEKDERLDVEEAVTKEPENDGKEGVNTGQGPEIVLNSEHDEGIPDESKKKKNRKKKSKKKKNKDDIDAGLQILSKKDWKRLRNKYLNMQKEKMKQLKKHISLAKKKSDSSKQNGMFKKNEKNSTQNDSDKVVEFKKNEKNSRQNDSDKVVEATTQSGKIYSPGVIVKVKCDEPVTEIKELKKDLKKTNPSLMFVDVREGDSVMHLRFASSDAAMEFCKSSSWSNTKVLKGDKEIEYWNKIQEQREEKTTKKMKKKERGKDKLMRKAEKILGKHITFD